jgi:hypothetical protein
MPIIIEGSVFIMSKTEVGLVMLSMGNQPHSKTTSSSQEDHRLRHWADHPRHESHDPRAPQLRSTPRYHTG